jgi:hypothetical protein
VQHLVIDDYDSVLRFHRLISFSIKAKAEELNELSSIFSETSYPQERYARFTSSYSQVGRKWRKIQGRKD